MATRARSIDDARPQDGEAAMLDRRAALGSLAGAAGLLIAPKIAKAATTNEALLLDIEARHSAALAAFLPVDNALKAAEDAIRRIAGLEPSRRPYRYTSRRQCRRQEREFRAAHEVWKASRAQAETDYSLPCLQKQFSACYDTLARIEGEVWETPAQSFAELQIKGRIASRRPEVSFSILRDVGYRPGLAPAVKEA